MVVFAMSILNRKHNVLFIHVPRTAGTSMGYAKFLGGGGHETIRDFYNVDDVFKFSFVRNPWDRFISALLCQEHYLGIDRDGVSRFIMEQCAEGEYPRDGVYRMHFLPQHHFLLDHNDNLGVDFLGRFELLKTDWETVCAILGVSHELPHHRKTERSSYQYYYTPETWDIIGELYQQDVELFGYG
jgi:hypothetical protein